MNSKRKVLIIEDESDISRILRDYLTKNQYEAAVAATGQDGLQIMELIQPDYIILDIMLPDMDGIEVCGEIRRRNNIPISSFWLLEIIQGDSSGIPTHFCH
ncbi:response regulator [Paenibacillus sp. PAMC 26794]|uniref:response regulator n=1 Tax=Paenibacillus sp. PAMC 26794 TaxID=1257080 RepID=UPI00031B7DE9|nr:response regulator [Paenibacillus sp. PAMC 26794]